MRTLDRVLQRWRGRLARPWIEPGARVLDVGCFQGEFLASLGDGIGPSVGLDPLAEPAEFPRFRVEAGVFGPGSPWPDGSFDAVVMLATLEHVRDKDPVARECLRLLRPGGRVVVTVPSRRVDAVVDVLRVLRLVDGMSLEEHHGFDPLTAPEIFGRHGFDLVHARRFQLGLNHLFVMAKPGGVGSRTRRRNPRKDPTIVPYAGPPATRHP